MLFHPLSIAVILADVASLYFLFSALSLSIRLLLQDADADSRRNALPVIKQESVTGNGRLVLILQCLSFLLILLGVSLFFPPVLTGIMCGTGVLQIGGETGVRMLLVKICALLALYVWYQIDRANRQLPAREMDMAAAKAMLCCVPFALLSVWLTIKTLWVLNAGQSGDCCSLAYGAAANGSSVNLKLWLLLLAGFSLILFLFGIAAAGKKKIVPLQLMATPGGGFLWVVTASVCLYWFFSAYYYGVSQHHCLWCLFLPGNYSVGYLFFIILAVVLSQSIFVFVHGRIAMLQPALSIWSRRKMQQSGRLIIIGMIVYFLLILIPVLLWKIQHGVWAV